MNIVYANNCISKLHLVESKWNVKLNINRKKNLYLIKKKNVNLKTKCFI